MPVPRTESVKSLSDLSILHTHLPTTGILPIPHTLACSHNLYSIHSTHSHAYNLYPFHTLLPSHNLYSIHSTLSYTQFLSISHTHLHTIRIHFTHSPTNSLYSIRSTRSHAYNLYPFHTHTPAHNLYSIHPTHSHNLFGIPGRSMGSVSLSREAFVHTHKLYRILSRKFIRVIYNNMANHYKDLSKHTHTRTLSLSHTHTTYTESLSISGS